ncbi:MAG: NAD-dependent epimerase/dehydratase family protein [Coriobacteriia bacterium]
MRVLVTGGAGFIGSNLTHALITGGHQVGVIDDLSTGSPQNIHPHAWSRTLDILDSGFSALVAEFAPDAVVHLAAQASVSVSLQDPERDWAVNAEGTRVVAQAAREAGAKRMVSASSAAVYGEPLASDLPLSETAPKAPANPYGKSKLAAEGLLAAELAGSGVDHASFRFSNVYGPRQDGAGEGGVVAIFCTRMQAGQSPVVFGTGAQTRDFIYVGDVVAAIISALLSESPLAGEGPDGAAFNISTGEEASVEALLLALRQASGYLGGVDYEPAREGDVDRSSLDPGKAARVFDWSARQPLDKGAAVTWRWFAASS